MKKLLILCSLFVFYSCVKNDGTSTGNPLVSLSITGSQQVATASFRYNKYWWVLKPAYAFAPPPTMLDLSNGTVSLTEFWLNFSNIEFKFDELATAGEVDGNEVKFLGPYLVNIFSSSPQSLGNGLLSQSSIRRIKYRTRKVLDSVNGNPADMINNSVYLAGNINSKSFVFKTTQELQFETSGPNLVTFKSGDVILLQPQTAEMIRKINLSSIIHGDIITESNRKPFTNPCPTIDASAADLYTCFIKGIQVKTKLGKDNGDNVFSPGEPTVN